jgi:hypothetical protein
VTGFPDAEKLRRFADAFYDRIALAREERAVAERGSQRPSSARAQSDRSALTGSA